MLANAEIWAMGQALVQVSQPLDNKPLPAVSSPSYACSQSPEALLLAGTLNSTLTCRHEHVLLFTRSLRKAQETIEYYRRRRKNFSGRHSDIALPVIGRNSFIVRNA